MNLTESVVVIRRTLTRERAMRERVFRGTPAKQKAKMAEIDTALAHLAELERRLVPDAPQVELFP